MILPIVAYGHQVLRTMAEDIDENYPHLDKLVEDMWETMYASHGVGLASPQVNRPIRLFVVDTAQIFENRDEDDEDYPDAPGIRQVFINAHIEELVGQPWSYNEGCLSIPKIREDVSRHEGVTLRYFDLDFKERLETFNGITARVILHEYDHIEGKLFIDHISLLKRKLIKGKLDDISRGKIKVDYRMLFPR
jgi:peptide deformylase